MSPASYLTAPPRVAAAIVATVARQSRLWIALAAHCSSPSALARARCALRRASRLWRRQGSSRLSQASRSCAVRIERRPDRGNRRVARRLDPLAVDRRPAARLQLARGVELEAPLALADARPPIGAARLSRSRDSERRRRRPGDELDAPARRGRRGRRLEEVVRRTKITRLGEGVDTPPACCPLRSRASATALPTTGARLRRSARSACSSARARSATPRTARRSSARSSGATGSTRQLSGDEEAS